MNDLYVIMIKKFVILLLILTVAKCDYFILSKDYSVNSTVNLISISNNSLELKCIGLCHSNQYCLTAMFKTKKAINNCYLYNKHFNSNETNISINSNIYDRISKTPAMATKTSTTLSKTSTTLSNGIFNIENNNNSLLKAFKDFTLKRTLNNTGNSFNWFKNLTIGTATLYLLDNSDNKISILDENWMYLRNVSFNSPAYMVKKDYILYISADTTIFKTDQNLNTLSQYNGSSSSKYRGIYYDSIDDCIYVANYAKSRVEIFTSNLNLLDTIVLSSYKPFSVQGLNNKILVGDSNNGVLLTIEKKVITDAFDVCNGKASLVSSIILDKFGYMATTCFNSNSNLYFINGTFTGLTMPTQLFPYQAYFDPNGQFIIISDTTISIYNDT